MAFAKMLHDEDPRERLLRDLGNLNGIQLLHNQVLLAVYERPEKTSSGIILAPSTRREDQYQGKPHLVVKKGPAAFLSSGEWTFPEINVGDWVILRPSDGWALGVQGVREPINCRMVVDTSIKGLLTSPDLIW
jgi:co-chaperonin GroES (HSP10)